MRECQEGKDDAKLAQILSECFGPTTPRQVRRWIKQSGGKSFVLDVEGDEVVSSVGIEYKELHLGEGVHVKTAGIGGVCTCSDYRRKGIMTNLLRQSLNYTKSSGVSNSTLYTGLTLPAHRIYQRLGFCDVQTWLFYVKFLDYPYVFRTWLRELNRYLKCSKIAREVLRDWNRSVVFELEKVGPQPFRFQHSRFQKLKKPPRFPDLAISMSIETLIRVMWGAIKFEDATKTGKMLVKRGTEADLRVLRKVLIQTWDD